MAIFRIDPYKNTLLKPYDTFCDSNLGIVPPLVSLLLAELPIRTQLRIS